MMREPPTCYTLIHIYIGAENTTCQPTTVYKQNSCKHKINKTWKFISNFFSKLQQVLKTTGFNVAAAAPMTQTHTVYPLIWHATFFTCHHDALPSSVKDRKKDWRKTDRKKQGQRSLQTDRVMTSKCLHLIPLLLLVFILKWIYLRGTPLAVRLAGTKRAVEEQEISQHHPAPPGHSQFYILLLISIKITVIRRHARHEVDEQVEQM